LIYQRSNHYTYKDFQTKPNIEKVRISDRTVDVAIGILQAKLPFLVGLTAEERKYLPKMGDKSRAFVLRALEVGQKNQGMLPRAFDLEEMRRDVELYQALYPIYLAVNQLAELIDDSLTEIGSESYAAALVIYNGAKTNGKA
jgi:hypothetical protein